MAERKSFPKKTQKDYMSDDDTSDEETDQRLRTTPKKRDYGTIPGLAQATQAALSHSRAQTNPTIECRPPREKRSQNLQQDNTRTKTPEKKSISTFYEL